MNDAKPARHTGVQFWTGIWRIVDPKITLASVAGMLLGTALAAKDGPINWIWLAVTVAGVFCIEFAKNASGEVFDWDSGTDRALRPQDRSPFSGGKRVLVDDLLTRSQVWTVALLFYLLAFAAAIAVAIFRESSAIALATIGIAVAYFYHAPPLKFAYRGLGELAVTFIYGPMLSAGTYLVLRNGLSYEIFLAGLPVGLLVGAFLWINEFPDRVADATAGKRTLVVRLGTKRAAVAFTLIVICSFIALILLAVFHQPRLCLLGLVGAGPGLAASRRLLRSHESIESIIPAQALTLLSFMLTSIGMSLGILLGK